MFAPIPSARTNTAGRSVDRNRLSGAKEIAFDGAVHYDLSAERSDIALHHAVDGHRLTCDEQIIADDLAGFDSSVLTATHLQSARRRRGYHQQHHNPNPSSLSH